MALLAVDLLLPDDDLVADAFPDERDDAPPRFTFDDEPPDRNDPLFALDERDDVDPPFALDERGDLAPDFDDALLELRVDDVDLPDVELPLRDDPLFDEARFDDDPAFFDEDDFDDEPDALLPLVPDDEVLLGISPLA